MSNSVIKKLLLLSGFCIALEVFRMFTTASLNYIFLPFNLLLAWMPLAFALLVHKAQTSLRIFIGFCLWLLFFPNSPYIITDLIHLKPRNDFPLWFDAMLIYSFAFTGLIVGMFSAIIIYHKLKGMVSGLTAKATMFLLMLISGYGIYIGRFLRWNSWNVVTDPLLIFYDTASRVAHPLSYPRTYGVTLMMGTLLCLVFFVFESLTLKEEA
ncbi:MAG: DUF1361 domain-containing protein [Chitinophagales bacterium]|nr:DUF1361 domain-containing protein [Chitinophagales bacterium]